MKALFFILFVFFLRSICFSQDIHWSQFNDNQLFQNPANAGHFDGDYRFIANYRDQWRSVTVPFSTISGSVDARWKSIGYGLLFFHDVAGDGKFRTVELQFNASNQFKLTKDSSNLLRLGVNFGLNHRQINWNNLYFDSQYNGYIFDPSAPTFENFQSDKKSNYSLGLGALYEWRKHKRFSVISGFSAFNINQPNHGFYSQEIKRDVRYSLFSKGTFQLDRQWDIIPSMQLSFQGVYRELILGGSAKYYLPSKLGDYKALHGGLWFRNRDAAYLTLGMDYQQLFVGISYDINVSKLVPASNLRGGFEIAIRYIINAFKPKKIIHRVCPDFI